MSAEKIRLIAARRRSNACLAAAGLAITLGDMKKKKKKVKIELKKRSNSFQFMFSI